MRPTLPAAPSLPVAYLAAGFGDVTNAYKFYWLLAILTELQPSADSTMPISRLLAQMVAAAWTPAVLFRLHFGKQDRLGELATALHSAHGLPNDQLPDFARYFEPFATLQYGAVQAVAAQGKAALLEEC